MPKKYNAIIQRVKSKEFFLYAIVTVFAIFFKGTIDSFFKYFLGPVFGNLESGPIKDLFWLVIAGLTIGYYVIRILRKDVASARYMRFIWFTLVAYLFFFGLWGKYSKMYYLFWRYTDIVLIYIGMYLGFYLLQLQRSNQGREGGILIAEDSLGEVDLLGRTGYAKKIANEILAISSDNSFAIGILGEWGSGKTHFMKSINKSIDNEAITIWFNPWLSESPEKIIENFFLCLEKELNLYSDEISRHILKYIDALLPVKTRNPITSAITNFLNFNAPSNAQDQYGILKKSIRKLGRKVVIFIDDIDRLDDKEVFEVLKIIRNTANFKNVIFVAAYDKNYVDNVLKNLKINNHTKFSEKIFQLEITLPLFDHITLNEQITKMIKGKVSEKTLEKLKEPLNVKRGAQLWRLTEKYLLTLRDVIRFSNLLCIEIQGIQDNVIPKEFFVLTLFKLKYKKHYDKLYKEHGQWVYFGTGDKDQWDNNDKRESLRQFIGKDQLIHETLKVLFPNRLSDISEDPRRGRIRRFDITKSDYKSICSSKNFETYFTPNLPSRLINLEEFKSELKEILSQEKIEEAYKLPFRNWKGKEKHLHLLINEINFGSEINFGLGKKYFKHLLNLLYHLQQDQEFGFHIKLEDQLFYHNNRITEEYFDSEDEYRRFMRGFLQENYFPSLFLSYTDHRKFILEKEEVHEIMRSHFYKKIDSFESLKVLTLDDMNQLHDYSWNILPLKESSFFKDSDVESRVISLFSKHPKTFINYLVKKIPNREGVYELRGFYFCFFPNSEQENKEFLTKNNVAPKAVEEFLFFYEKYTKRNKWDHGVSFEFKRIQPTN